MKYEIIRHILVTCFPGLAAFLFLSSFIIFDRTFAKKDLTIISNALMCPFFLMLFESAYYFFVERKSHHQIVLFMLAFCFFLRGSCSALFAIVSHRSNSMLKKIIYMTVIFNAVLSFSSIPTGCIFYLKDDFTIGRGFLYNVHYAFVFSGCLFMLSAAVKNLRENSGETLLLVGSCVFPLSSMYLEFAYNIKMLVPISYLTCIIFYFMCFNVQLYRRDTLTKLLNRRSFYIDAKRSLKKPMLVLSMDLNSLKYYNDTFGHSAGDEALLTVVKYMQLAFTRYGTVYRTGGDEFMALFVKPDKDAIIQRVKFFQGLLSATKYRVAVGLSLYKPGDNFEDIVAESDAKMYRNKIAYKQRRVEEILKKKPELATEAISFDEEVEG